MAFTSTLLIVFCKVHNDFHFDMAECFGQSIPCSVFKVPECFGHSIPCSVFKVPECFGQSIPCSVLCCSSICTKMLIFYFLSFKDFTQNISLQCLT